MTCSRAPPAGGEDPGGIGVKQPPNQDDRGDQKHAESLVATKSAKLPRAPGVLLGLLAMRLDAGVNQSFLPQFVCSEFVA